MDENILIDYRFYYKPRVNDFNDYLLEHELKISIATFYEALSIDLNYTDYGVNIYINSKGNGLYASLGSGSLSSLIFFEEIELTDENGNKGVGSSQVKENISTFNIKFGIKSNSKVFFRLEVGYGIGNIPDTVNFEAISSAGIPKEFEEDIPPIPGLSSGGTIIGSIGFGIAF